MLVLVSDEKLKWSKELANRLGLQAEHQRPFSLIYPTACDPPQGQFPWSVPTGACSVGSGARDIIIITLQVRLQMQTCQLCPTTSLFIPAHKLSLRRRRFLKQNNFSSEPAVTKKKNYFTYFRELVWLQKIKWRKENLDSVMVFTLCVTLKFENVLMLTKDLFLFSVTKLYWIQIRVWNGYAFSNGEINHYKTIFCNCTSHLLRKYTIGFKKTKC